MLLHFWNLTQPSVYQMSLVYSGQYCQCEGGFTRRIGLHWNRLPQVKTWLVGWPKFGLLFICLPAAALFSSNLPVSAQFREVFEPFQCPRTCFSSISGIKTSSSAINIDYPPHAEVINLIVFLPYWVILIILQPKSTQIWETGRIITW